ncbi:MAG: hypothetical protein JRJ69_07185 [Deltaproteobacteria bacterium]|nr:hypothetical protein [Deltaproteobacteria bacterium]RLB33073.1 MAG: hypothetical protein DRH11_09870 [Deltaproteobacteria bacterium]
MKLIARSFLFITLLVPTIALGSTKPYPFLVGAGKGSIILRWAPPEAGFPEGGFNVYRKPVGTTVWRKLNPTPLVRITDQKVLRERLGDDLFKAVSGLISPAPLKVKGERSRKIQEGNRLSLLLLYADFSPKVADVLGLRWEDHEVKRDQRYVYRLTVLGPRGKESTLATLAKPIGLEDYRTVTKPLGFSAKPGDGEISFFWIKEPRFSAYNLYRSDQENGTYEKINTAPIIILTTTGKSGEEKVSEILFKDTKVRNGKTYWYYLEGVDAFGRKSIPTQKISATPIDLTPPMAPGDLKTEVEGTTVNLSWEKSPEKDAYGYHVYRGLGYKGPFARLTKDPIPAYYTHYKDKNLPLRATFWYYVTAVDTTGNESGPSYTAPANIVDREPPAPPKGLKGKAEPGKVILSWIPNKEEDLAGYRIYRAMEKDSKHYALLNEEPVKKASFVNELPKTASDNPFFFKIKAVDTSGNESEFSNPVKVKLPDVTPPIAPVFRTFRVREGTIELRWYPNTEDDLAGYDIYRSKAGDKPATSTKLNKKLIPSVQHSFTDKGMSAGEKYVYALRAVDTSGNASPQSRPLVASTFDKTPPPPPGELKAKSLKDGKGILITWKMPRARDLRGVILYRASKKTGPYYPVSPVTVETRFLDTRVRTGKVYYYRTASIDRSNNRSQYSKVVQVHTKKP